MKFSAILFSVNLVAVTMPLAAQAAEEAVSDKADWLKKSIAAIETTRKPSSRKVSLSDPGITTVAAKAQKLRPFVANRKLPSAHDLELSALRPRLDTSIAPTLTAQQPTLGVTDKPLAAQISAYAIESSYNDARRATAPLPAAPRAVPGHQPSLPGQVAARRTSAPVIPVIPEPPVTAAAPPAYMNLQPPGAPKLSRLPASIQPERLLKQAGALLVQAPALSPDERHLVDELVELNKPGHSKDFIDVQSGQPVVVPSAAEDMPAAPQAPVAGESEIGPPPFPLNLLPQDQLKEFVGRRKQQKLSAPHVYFGSWHRQISAQAPAALPYAGFQTHLACRRILANNYSQYASRIGYPQSNAASRKAKKSANNHYSPVSHSAIAVYPSYENVNRVSMF